MRKTILAMMTLAAAGVASFAGAAPAAAHDYPYCLQGKEYGLPGLCQFATYEQCQATARGTTSYCGLNPRFAYALQPRGLRPRPVR